nr:uncharacterized protein LOC123497221 [Aegilops tauschii subsp. strangulata]
MTGGQYAITNNLPIYYIKRESSTIRSWDENSYSDLVQPYIGVTLISRTPKPVRTRKKAPSPTSHAPPDLYLPLPLAAATPALLRHRSPRCPTLPGHTRNQGRRRPPPASCATASHQHLAPPPAPCYRRTRRPTPRRPDHLRALAHRRPGSLRAAGRDHLCASEAPPISLCAVGLDQLPAAAAPRFKLEVHYMSPSDLRCSSPRVLLFLYHRKHPRGVRVCVCLIYWKISHFPFYNH